MINKIKQNDLIMQALKFFAISGIGWIIDFSVFSIISKKLSMNIFFINIISSTPAIIYVFIMSSKKIFKNYNSKLSLKTKYLIYFVYQILLLFLISKLAQFLFNTLSVTDIMQYHLISNYLKIIIKIFITPITMTINFIVMKKLIEKL